MNVGRWQPSKFFVFELCTIYDLYNWFITLIPLVIWTALSAFAGLTIPSILVNGLNPELELKINAKYTPLEKDTDLTLLAEEYFDSINILEEEDNNDKILPFNQEKYFDALLYLQSAFDAKIFNTWVQKDFEKFELPYIRQNYEWTWQTNLKNEYVTRLNFIYVVRSYINWWIWVGVRHFLFFYVYYYFPKLEYSPHYIQELILEKYFFFKKHMLSLNLKQNSIFYYELPNLAELHFDVDFLLPTQIDKKLPWFEFKEIFLFTLKPILVNFTKFIKQVLYCSQNSFLITKYLQITDYANPILLNILNWLVAWEIINLGGVFSTFFYEAFGVDFFFSTKKWQISLFLIKKRNSYKDNLNLSILSNDREFFWPINSEFSIKKGIYRLKKPRGWPKKREDFFFESESEFFSIKKTIVLNTNDLKRQLSFKRFKINYSLNFKFLNYLFLAYKKPF